MMWILIGVLVALIMVVGTKESYDESPSLKCEPCKIKGDKNKNLREDYPCAYGPAMCCKRLKNDTKLIDLDKCWTNPALRDAATVIRQTAREQDLDDLVAGKVGDCQYYTRTYVPSARKWVCHPQARFETGFDWDSPHPELGGKYQCAKTRKCAQQIRKAAVCAANADTNSGEC